MDTDIRPKLPDTLESDWDLPPIIDPVPDWATLAEEHETNSNFANWLREHRPSRELTLRRGRKHRPLILTRSPNVEAILAQVRGTEEPEPCMSCIRRGGPFAQCVTVNGWMRGSCANCHYGSEGPRCSLRPDFDPYTPSPRRRGRKATTGNAYYPSARNTAFASSSALSSSRPSSRVSLQSLAVRKKAAPAFRTKLTHRQFLNRDSPPDARNTRAPVVRRRSEILNDIDRVHRRLDELENELSNYEYRN
jgi:Protein of unknown function (DUF3716)